MKQIAFSIFILFMAANLFGQVDYEKWDKLLSHSVSDKGKVDYEEIKTKYANELSDFLSALQNVKLESLSNDEKLAFWINTYNAFTVKLIVDHYPVSSIQDIENGKPWDKKWIEIQGEGLLSLNDIEHEIIRKRFDEPRIHFAVNCAAQSCPPLLNEAYIPGQLNQQLEEQTVKFINASRFNTISKDKVEVSQLFNWYGKDFGNIISYINNYIESPQIKTDAKVSFKDYDWSLNN